MKDTEKSVNFFLEMMRSYKTPGARITDFCKRKNITQISLCEKIFETYPEKYSSTRYIQERIKSIIYERRACKEFLIDIENAIDENIFYIQEK